MMRPRGVDQMRRFWDSRARENAYYFVNNQTEAPDSDDDAFWTSGARDLGRVTRLLGIELTRDDRVLEIGCGVGRMTRVLAEHAGAVLALDVSPEMIERARAYNPRLANVDWIVSDGRALAGIDQGTVDCCLSYVVFQHIPDPEVTLGYVREIGRVLRPGGWAALQVSDLPPRSQFTARLAALLGPLRARLPSGWAHHPAWRGSTVTPSKLQASAKAAGLSTERVEGAGTQYCFVLLRREG